MQTSDSDEKIDSVLSGRVSRSDEQGCGCREAVNAKLREYGGELLASLFSEPPRLFVSTIHRADVKRKKKLPLVIATFCPFCGVRVPEDTGPLAKLKAGSPS